MKRTVVTVVSIILSIVLTISASSALTPTYLMSESYRNGEYYNRLVAVELTGNYADDIVNVAMSQKGYHEGSSSTDLSGFGSGYGDYCEYCSWYGCTFGWCAVFISWCARQAGIPEKMISNNSWVGGHGGNYGEKYVYDFGKYEPKKGDICYVDNTGDGIVDHVGIVYKTDDEYIYALEGNTSQQVYDIKYHKSSGSQFYYTDTKIVCYGVPEYNAEIKTDVIKGDIDGSGTVTSFDALLVLKHSTELEFLPDDKTEAADINGDGKITSEDALLILIISVGAAQQI